MLRFIRWALAAGAALVVSNASASDLGSAGQFRMIGGESCLRASPPCTLPAVDPNTSAADQSHVHVVRALMLIDALRLAEARRALDEAVTRDPSNVSALALRGRVALANGNLGDAGRDTEQALVLKPQDPDLLATRAFIRQARHELPQSLEDANASLKIRPDSIDALYIRATILSDLKQYGLAFADLSFALTLAPDDRRIRMMRAQTQMTLQQYQFAALDAAQVLKTDPHDADALMIRATALELSGDEEGAIKDLSDLLDANGRESALALPRLREAAIRRIRLLAHTGRSAEAEDGMALILKIGGQRAILRMQLYLRANGYPNVEITGARSAVLDTALKACFADKRCGPQLPPG